MLKFDYFRIQQVWQLPQSQIKQPPKCVDTSSRIGIKWHNSHKKIHKIGREKRPTSPG